MAGNRVIEPRLGSTPVLGRPRTVGDGGPSWSDAVMHAVAVTLVVSLAGVVLLVTGAAASISLDATHDWIAGIDWTMLLADFLHDLLTDEQGAPLLVVTLTEV